jgi:hypothetical protein
MAATVPVALQEWFAAYIETRRSSPLAGTPASRRDRPGTFVYSDETSCSAGEVVVDIYKSGEGYDSYAYSSYTGLDTIEHFNTLAELIDNTARQSVYEGNKCSEFLRQLSHIWVLWEADGGELVCNDAHILTLAECGNCPNLAWVIQHMIVDDLGRFVPDMVLRELL